MTHTDTVAWVRELWQHVRPQAATYAAELERHARACTRAPVDEASREAAVDVAHRLAGSLGSYGVVEGSELADAIRTRLRAPAGDDGADETVVELAVRLRHLVETC